MIAENDRGFLLGDGVFETVLVINGSPLWLDAHLARMKKAARKLDLPFDGDAIAVAVAASAKPDFTSVLRITLTRGITARGLAADCETPTLHIACVAFDPHLIGKSLRLATSSVRRNPTSVSDRHKTLSYANNVFASREAKTRGADDALMLNIDGYVACTPVANLFMMSGGKLVTPPEQDGVLAGIMRRFIIEHSGFAVDVRSFEPDELFDAEAVFATNSLRLASAVTEVDGTALKTGPITGLMDAIRAAIKTQCGADPVEDAT